MNDDLIPLLRDLPEPAPPSSLTATVMARIERESDARSVVPVKTAADLRVWLWTFTGIAIVVVLFAKGWLTVGMPPDLMTPRLGVGRAMLVPIQGPTLWLVGVGLLVYLAGLFAPLRGSERD